MGDTTDTLPEAVAEPKRHFLLVDLVIRLVKEKPLGTVGGVIVLLMFFSGVFADFLAPYGVNEIIPQDRLNPSSTEHILGTDNLGRDLLTRCLYGGRVSLSVGFMVVIITLVIGVPVGAVAGYFGGWVDSVIMRITDAFLSLPSLLVLILLSAILREIDIPLFERNNVLTIALVIGVLSWMTVARLVRASYLTIRELEFVTAANCMGASNLRIMGRHIFPNAVGPIIVEATLEMGYAIMEEAGLSFLGFGIQPPTPSWGNLLSNAQEHLTKQPWLAIFPGLMIFFTIISINYIGDGLRDAFDPFKVLEQIGEA